MGRVGYFHHDYRVADFRLDVKAFAGFEAFQLDWAEGAPHQFQHSETTVEVCAHWADSVTDLFRGRIHGYSLPRKCCIRINPRIVLLVTVSLPRGLALVRRGSYSNGRLPRLAA